MYYLTLLEILAVTLYSAYLIQYYTAKDVHISVKFMALVSWLINFVLLILLPLDIYITFRDAQSETKSSEYLTLSYVLLGDILGLLSLILEQLPPLLDSHSHRPGV